MCVHSSSYVYSRSDHLPVASKRCINNLSNWIDQRCICYARCSQTNLSWYKLWYCPLVWTHSFQNYCLSTKTLRLKLASLTVDVWIFIFFCSMSQLFIICSQIRPFHDPYFASYFEIFFFSIYLAVINIWLQERPLLSWCNIDIPHHLVLFWQRKEQNPFLSHQLSKTWIQLWKCFHK